MATTTTNYGLTKPAYSDTADIAAVNGNMDKIDTALGGIDEGIAIVANGNTHGAITSGQYVYVRGHNTLAEGMYKATANIAANGTLSGSNVTSAALGTDLASLSSATVRYTDVVNNLTSTETSKPLSAAQGKALSDQIATLTTSTMNNVGVGLSYDVEYTAPTDGYVRAIGPSTGNITITVNGLYILQASNGEYSSLYIRKGMKIKQVTNNGGSGIFFKIE